MLSSVKYALRAAIYSAWNALRQPELPLPPVSLLPHVTKISADAFYVRVFDSFVGKRASSSAPKMGTETLRLLFIVALMCTVADLMMEEDYGPCSRVPEHVDATISDIRPKKYFVQLTILPDKGQMSGSVEITVQTTVPVNSVSLFARNLHVSQRCTRILWNDEDLPSCDQKARYRVRDLIICEEREMVTMFFANTVPVGTHVLHIEYSTLFEQNMYLLNFPYSWNGADRR